LKKLIAAGLIALPLVGCSGNPRSETAPTTTTTAITLGQDPTKSTTATASLAAKVADSLRANGFEVAGLKERDPEGGRLFGMKESWDVRVNGDESFINVFGDSEDLSGWLQTAGNLGGVVVFSTTDVWALSLDTDSPAVRAKSKKLADEIGKKLYDDWNDSIRTIGA
jgi:hypothetical protein